MTHTSEFSLWIMDGKTYAVSRTYSMIKGICITDDSGILYYFVLPGYMKSVSSLTLDDAILFVLAYEYSMQKKYLDFRRCIELEIESIHLKDNVYLSFDNIKEMMPHDIEEIFRDYELYKSGSIAEIVMT